MMQLNQRLLPIAKGNCIGFEYIYYYSSVHVVQWPYGHHTLTVWCCCLIVHCCCSSAGLPLVHGAASAPFQQQHVLCCHRCLAIVVSEVAGAAALADAAH
jgi:hypothetical protein